jgi:hypothetical protein
MAFKGSAVRIRLAPLVNNNEMGVYISRSTDTELYRDAFEESQRIIRISDEVRMSLEKVASATDFSEAAQEDLEGVQKLSSSKIAKKFNMRTGEFLERLTEAGFLDLKDDKHYLTQKGKAAGGEFRMSKKFGPYFIWPDSFSL